MRKWHAEMDAAGGEPPWFIRAPIIPPLIFLVFGRWALRIHLKIAVFFIVLAALSLIPFSVWKPFLRFLSICIARPKVGAAALLAVAGAWLFLKLKGFL